MPRTLRVLLNLAMGLMDAIPHLLESFLGAVACLPGVLAGDVRTFGTLEN